MRAVSLLLAPLAAPLFFASPADSAFLAPCCGTEGSVEPEDAPPILVGAKVRRPDELALEANAEEPRPKQAPLADAVAVPDKDEALPRIIVPPTPIPVVADDDAAPNRDFDNPNTEPCCGAEAEPEDPPPVLVGANVTSPDERALEAAAEAPVPDEIPLADAIGETLNELPELPEPGRQNAPIIAEGNRAPESGGFDDLSDCCQTEGETHPPDRHPEEEVSPPLVAAKVKNREKVGLLEMAVEAPITKEVPLVDAIGVPLYPIEEERRGVSEPDIRPVTAEITAPDPTEQVQGVDDHGEPCCTAPEPEDPFEFVGAKVKNRQERALEATAEAQVPVRAPRTVAIARPLDERPAVSEPARVPVTLLLVLVILLTIGLFRPWRRRRELREDEAAPTMGPLPDELAAPATAPQPEPEVALARAKAEARELEPA